MRLNLYLVLVCSLVYEVEGWSCTSPVRKVFTTTGTNAVLQFTADLSNLITPRSFTVKFYDNTDVCRIRYTINKTSSGYCAVGFSFTGDTAGKVTVTLQNVQQNNSGIYGMTTAGLLSRCYYVYILGVPTNPVIKINGTPSVGDNTTLTCSSTSTTSPSNHSLTMEYNWRVGNFDITTGTKYSYSTDRKYLYISNIGKEDANKQYTCTAREDVNDGITSSRSDDFSFDVYYGPENMSLSPSDMRYEREENSILSYITCKASCHPTCSFKWTKGSQVADVNNTAVLDLGSLSTSKAGTYICTATRSNTVTQSMSFTVNVIYMLSVQNVVKVICTRQIGYKKTENVSTLVVCKMLDNLYEKEHCFDHPLINDLFLLIKKIATRNTIVRGVIIDTIERWEKEIEKAKILNDPEYIVSVSHVFLSHYIMEFVSEETQTLLRNLTDEIRSESL